MTEYRNPYTGDPPARVQNKCPHCKRQSGVFFCAADRGESWFRCIVAYGKHACGRYFTAATPKPLKRTWSAPNAD